MISPARHCVRRRTASIAYVVDRLESRAYCAGVPQVKVDVKLVEVDTNFAKSVGVNTKSFADLTLRNVGTAAASGKATLAVYASKDGKLDAGDRLLTQVTRNLNVPAGGTSEQHLNFTYPGDLVKGKYHLIGKVTPKFADRLAANNVLATTALVNLVLVNAAVLQLTFGQLPANFPFGVPNDVPATLKNTGKAATTGPATVKFYASTDQTLGNADDRLLTTLVYKQILLAAASAKLNLKFTTPLDFIAGFYYAAASVFYAQQTRILFSQTRIAF